MQEQNKILYILQHSTWLGHTWDWWLEFSATAAEPLLYTSMIYAGLKLADPSLADRIPTTVDAGINIGYLIGLDAAGFGLMAKAQTAQAQGNEHGAASARRLGYTMLGVMILNLALSSILSLFGVGNILWLTGLLLVVRAILAVCYSSVARSLRATTLSPTEWAAEQKRVDEIENENTQLKNENETLRGQVRRRESENENLRAQLVATENENETLRGQARRRESENETLKKALAETREGDTQLDLSSIRLSTPAKNTSTIQNMGRVEKITQVDTDKIPVLSAPVQAQIKALPSGSGKKARMVAAFILDIREKNENMTQAQIAESCFCSLGLVNKHANMTDEELRAIAGEE